MGKLANYLTWPRHGLEFGNWEFFFFCFFQTVLEKKKLPPFFSLLSRIKIRYLVWVLGLYCRVKISSSAFDLNILSLPQITSNTLSLLHHLCWMVILLPSLYPYYSHLVFNTSIYICISFREYHLLSPLYIATMLMLVFSLFFLFLFLFGPN